MPPPAKPELRRQLRATLAELTAQDRLDASQALCHALQAWPPFQQAAVIALFHPLATEPDLLPLLAIPGKMFLFPRCHRDRSLTWHEAGQPPQWQRNSYGIGEPDPAINPPVPSAEIQLVVLPGLAFTPAGQRLGQGAGFYDRFLATLAPGTPTAGVCFSCQILPTLPEAAHDIPVGKVLSA